MKICPLMSSDCCEKSCAWWGELAKKCGIKELEAIAINLAQICDYMEISDNRDN